MPYIIETEKIRSIMAIVSSARSMGSSEADRYVLIESCDEGLFLSYSTNNGTRIRAMVTKADGGKAWKMYMPLQTIAQSIASIGDKKFLLKPQKGGDALAIKTKSSTLCMQSSDASPMEISDYKTGTTIVTAPPIFLLNKIRMSQGFFASKSTSYTGFSECQITLEKQANDKHILWLSLCAERVRACILGVPVEVQQLEGPEIFFSEQRSLLTLYHTLASDMTSCKISMTEKCLTIQTDTITTSIPSVSKDRNVFELIKRIDTECGLDTEIVMPREKFVQCMQQGSLFADASNILKYPTTVSINDNVMRVSSKSQSGKTMSGLPIEYTGPPIKVWLNVQYIIQSMRALPKNIENIVLRLNSQDSSKPIMITSVEKNNFKFMFAPIMGGRS